MVGEVEDANSINDLITSASITGRPIPDFKNIDFKIASGLRKILKGNFQKQVTTAEGKAQWEKRSLTGINIAWMIHDFFKTSGGNEAILDLRDVSKVQLKNANVQAFDTKWSEVSSAVTNRPTDSILESLFNVLQVYTQETTFSDHKYHYCRLKLMGPRRKLKILTSKRKKSETRTDLQ